MPSGQTTPRPELLTILQAELSTSSLATAILDSRPPVVSRRLLSGLIEVLNHGNGGIAVEIAFLTSLQAELKVLPV